MGIKHVYVHEPKQVWDLWEAGLLYARGEHCLFPHDLFPSPLTDEYRKQRYSSWQYTNYDLYSYVVED